MVALVLTMLFEFFPQSVFAGLSFSGDVSLNTGTPNSPVMVGRQSTGSIQLDNGTTLASGPTQFGTTPTGIGMGVVTGARTAWTMSSTDVGFAGIGRLDISEGATVDTLKLAIGSQLTSNGTVRVDGAGTVLNVRGPLTVGTQGPSGAVGYLEITNGAIVNATQVNSIVGRNARVRLDDGLFHVSAFMNDGQISGSGELHVLPAGTFNMSGRLRAGLGEHLLVSGVGSTIQNFGIIEAHGGEIEIARPMNNAREGNVFGGEIILENGTVRIGASLTSVTQPHIMNTGLIAATGGENHFYGRVQIPQSSPTLGGEIAVTNDSVLVFHDDVTLQGGMFTVFAGSKATLLEDLSLTSGSMLLADISGSSVDTGYGEIEVVGAVNLGGGIRAAISDGYTPAAGDSFPIIKALGGVNGALALTDMPPLPNRLIWDLDIGTNHVALNVVQSPPGDYNADGVVDAGDYVVWRRALGQSGSGLAADGNSDGVVDAADYDHWRANFGSVAGGTSSTPVALATSVPEPATSVLFGVAALVLIGWSRQRVRG